MYMYYNYCTVYMRYTCVLMCNMLCMLYIERGRVKVAYLYSVSVVLMRSS